MNEEEYNLSLRNFFSVVGLPGFILLMRSLIMALISRQRSFSEATAVDASASIQILLAVLAFGAGVYYVFRNPRLRVLLFDSPLKWFIVYTLWCAATALWSVNGTLSLYRAFEVLAWTLLLSALLTHLIERLSVYQVITWILYYAVFDILTNIFISSLRYGIPLFSIATLVNEQFRSTTYFFLALLIPVGWLIKIIILPISIFSLSNTAYAGIAGGLVPLVFEKGRWRRIFIMTGIIVLIAISAVGVEKVLLQTIFYGHTGIGAEYTTGRDKIFDAAMQNAIENPWLGKGFVAGEMGVIKLRSTLMSVHNGFLSALVGTGLIGLFFLIFFFVRLFFSARSKYLPPELKVTFFSSVILITVHTLGNPGIGARVYGTWLPAMLVATLICVVQQYYKQEAYNTQTFQEDMGKLRSTLDLQ